MKRSDFVKGIIGLLGFSVLPKGMVKQYHRVYLLQSFISGFRFYKGPVLLDRMNEGDMLQMVREPENEYDDRAIALLLTIIRSAIFRRKITLFLVG